jgi:rubredoxin
MEKYVCSVCGYIYDETEEVFYYLCPVCGNIEKIRPDKCSICGVSGDKFIKY